MVSLPFRNREAAARELASALGKFRGSKPVVLAIPRGAVPMAQTIAQALGGELDVVLVRKLGAPDNPEYAIGAVDERGVVMLNAQAEWAGANADYVAREARHQLALIRERRASYRPGRTPVELEGRTVIVVDDGLATGATMIAALQAVRARKPAVLVCAVPVAAADSLDSVRQFADEVVCLATPWPFGAVGRFYVDFAGVSDQEVIGVLAAAAASGGDPGSVPGSARAVRIPVGPLVLEGDLVVPQLARGLVLFAHGSGSSRHSPRNRLVAAVLNQRGFATLLFDLLSADEDRERARRFDIPLLARRLEAALAWARREAASDDTKIGLFGASTGAAAAIIVAAAHAGAVSALVSRGGRPDLAGAPALSALRTPTLLIVGGADTQVLDLNRQAQAAIGQAAELAIVANATHLFEEPGALEQAARLAADWFDRWL
jgi:predicted phosphoribosyltransferase/predicted alpha/beta-hydrolase family hydrolase